MKCATVCNYLILATAIVLTACTENPARAPGHNPGSGFSFGDAASTGTTVRTMVELSDMYVSPETYDLNVTLAEIIRGEKSSEYLKKLGAPDVQPPADSEYLLARARFEYKARGAPGDKPWELSGAQFSAFSEENKPYGNPSLVAANSDLKPLLRPGDTLECWLIFIVSKSDRKPVMAFNPGGAWFRLY